MTTTYRRAQHYECEELEGELVIMERDSQAMVTLNPAGRLVWESIEKPITLDELEALFRDAVPNIGENTVRHDIRTVLDALVAAGLAITNQAHATLQEDD